MACIGDEGRRGEIAARLAESGLEQVLFNLPSGDWAGGERGIAVLPDRTEEFRAGVARAIDYARALDCPQVNCLAGIVPAGLEPARAEEAFVANLAYAAEALGKAGIEHTFLETEGAHHWRVWRRYLRDLAPLLFK